MTIHTLGWIQFRTHRVVVSQDLTTDHILCFKHTDTRCEWESFPDDQQATDYIIEPMRSIQYLVEFPEDS